MLLALLIGAIGFFMAVCMMFPEIFTTPQLRDTYGSLPIRFLLEAMLALSFVFALLSLLLLRGDKKFLKVYFRHNIGADSNRSWTIHHAFCVWE